MCFEANSKDTWLTLSCPTSYMYVNKKFSFYVNHEDNELPFDLVMYFGLLILNLKSEVGKKVNLKCRSNFIFKNFTFAVIFFSLFGIAAL
jgi:hypothetical protein